MRKSAKKSANAMGAKWRLPAAEPGARLRLGLRQYLYQYLYQYLFLAACCVLVAACATDKPDADARALSSQEEESSVEVLYEQANAALEEKDYNEATRLFEELERQHPYSQWATQAQMMAAYASYKDERYDEAILALERFIELHPGHKDIDYVFYLKALSYYEQISDVRRDQEMTENALESFSALILRFPQSRYARDAAFKRDLTRDHLAGKEMEIGRYYMSRGQINAAINRFRTVVREYQTTTHVPEALHRLVEAYSVLGLKWEARRVAAVLGHNYPGSKWYEDSYKILDPELRRDLLEDKSFIDRTIDSLFRPD